MKLWKKIFSYSVLFFIIMLNLAGMLVVEKTFEDNLEEGIRVAVNKYGDVENTLYLNSDYLLDVDISDHENIKNWINIIIKGYILSMSRERFNLELYTEDDSEILSDWERPIEGSRKEIEHAGKNACVFLIRKVDGERYVFISSIITIRGTDMKLILSSNLEHIYEKRNADYRFFLYVSIGISIVLGAGMYVISKSLTKPIMELSQSAMEIAKGNYGCRVAERQSEDEIELLKHNFNKMAEDIERNIMELRRHNEEKQRFIDSLNHEIKTPLTSIIGYSDLLLRSKVEEKVEKQALRYINEEARRLGVLNSTLLKLTLIREKEAASEQVSIAECIKKACDSMTYQLQKKEVTVSVQVAEEMVLGDRDQLEVLFVNLIDNACKASAEGSRIDVNGMDCKKEGLYKVTICDYGIGIAQEDLDKIMEPFYMADKARTRKENGIGLGLAICNEICMRNQIAIHFESKVGEGTLVSIIFHKENVGK